MNFLQRIGNALSRFMYGRNGADQLGLTTIWAALLLDVANMFIKQQTVHLVISFLSTVLLVIAVYRMFSRSLQKRRAENARFLEKVWWPINAAPPEISSSGWTRSTSTSPAPSAARCAACPRARARSSSRVPSAAARSTGKAEQTTKDRPSGHAGGAVFRCLTIPC